MSSLCPAQGLLCELCCLVTTAKNVKITFYLWNGKAFYMGIGLSSSLHQHHEVQVGISLGKPFKIRGQAAETYSSSVDLLFIPKSHTDIFKYNYLVQGILCGLETTFLIS